MTASQAKQADDHAIRIRSPTGDLSNTGLQTSTARLGIESARPTPPPVADIQGDFDLAKSASDQPGQTNAGDVLPAETTAKQVDGEEQISAADYNPDEDRKVDDEREQALLKAHNKQKEVASGVGEPGPDIVRVEDEESEYEEVEVDAEEDEDFDMFALDEPPKKKVIRRKKQVGVFDSAVFKMTMADFSLASPLAERNQGPCQPCSGRYRFNGQL